MNWMNRTHQVHRQKHLLSKLILTVLCLFTWWILYFMGMGALTPLDELRLTIGPALAETGSTAAWSLLPSWPTLQPLAELLLDTPAFFGMFWNTCMLVFPQLAGQLLVAAPAAWAFSKIPFRAKKPLYALYLVLMALPFQITMVPNYLVIDRLGLMDTPWAVILSGVFSTFPVFILKKGFDAIPDALLEAAALDGAGPLRRFTRIGLPLGLPGILSAATLCFLEAWNAIEQPLLFLKDKAKWPLSLYLSGITAEDLGQAMAASLMMLLPPLLLFLLGQKYLEQGIAIGGVKE